MSILPFGTTLCFTVGYDMQMRKGTTVQDHHTVESRTNGIMPSRSDPRTLFKKQIDTVLDRLAKAEVS